MSRTVVFNHGLLGGFCLVVLVFLLAGCVSVAPGSPPLAPPERGAVQISGKLTGLPAELRMDETVVAHLRVIRPETAELVAMGRFRDSFDYRIQAPEGLYILIATLIDASGKTYQGFTRALRVEAGEIRKIDIDMTFEAAPIQSQVAGPIGAFVTGAPLVTQVEKTPADKKEGFIFVDQSSLVQQAIRRALEHQRAGLTDPRTRFEFSPLLPRYTVPGNVLAKALDDEQIDLLIDVKLVDLETGETLAASNVAKQVGPCDLAEDLAKSFAPEFEEAIKRQEKRKPSRKPPRAPAPPERPPFTFSVPEKLPPAMIGEEYAGSFCTPSSSIAQNCGETPPSKNPTGGSPPYTFTGKDIPPGFILRPNGLFMGVVQPDTSPGEYSFEVCVEDRARTGPTGAFVTGAPLVTEVKPTPGKICRTVVLPIVARPLEFAVLEQLPPAMVGKKYWGSFCVPQSNNQEHCGESPPSINPKGGLPPYIISGKGLPRGITVLPNGEITGIVPRGTRPGMYPLEICAQEKKRRGSTAIGSFVTGAPLVTKVVEPQKLCRKTLLPVIAPQPEISAITPGEVEWIGRIEEVITFMGWTGTTSGRFSFTILPNGDIQGSGNLNRHNTITGECSEQWRDSQNIGVSGSVLYDNRVKLVFSATGGESKTVPCGSLTLTIGPPAHRITEIKTVILHLQKGAQKTIPHGEGSFTKVTILGSK